MNALAIVRNAHSGPHCLAICLEQDHQQLLKEHSLNEQIETMQLSIFRLFYNEAYCKYLRSDMPYCLGVFLEKFYDGQKNYHIDDNALFTDSFTLVVKENRIYMTLYIGCGALEVARLVLYLREMIDNAMVIEIDETTLFSDYSEN